MKPTLLVVDDVPQIQQYLRHHLERAGYSIFTCSNGQEALDILSQEQVDAVITDLVMPVMDGATLGRSVQKSYGIPVILLTHASNIRPLEESRTLARAEWAGIFTDVVMKPFHFFELQPVIEKAIGTLPIEDLGAPPNEEYRDQHSA